MVFYEIILDVTNSAHIQNLVDSIKAYDMPLVALVNNAGNFFLTILKKEIFEVLVNVNYLGSLIWIPQKQW